jgi:hypothetical protein
MKKASLLKHLSSLFFVVLLASCSTGHYAHLNKIQRDATSNDLAVKEIAKEVSENSEMNSETTPVAVQDKDCNEIATTPVDPTAKVNPAKQNKVKSNFVTNMLANRIMKTLPNKLNSVFAEKKNIAKHSSTSEKSNLLYIIVVALVILFLLGLLGGGGGLGNLIYIILVIAIVLLLLRLLGIA